MEPRLGWAWLSQTERRAAEQALVDLGPDGTRDELGFGVIHFAYADRFFPGTSVQQTKLRYVWFVSWSYLDLQRRAGGRPFPIDELKAMEDRTGKRLLARYGGADGTGIIGGRVLRTDGSPVVKPSVVYWNAMRSWGLVAPLAPGLEPPGRAEVHARWEELTSTRPRPEVDAEPARSIFVDPPPTPARWRSSDPLEFELDDTGGEAERIRCAWRGLRDARGRPALLSRLADRRGSTPSSPTAAEVLALCDEDEKTALRRAARAGALAAIARAVHTLLVQSLKEPVGQAVTVARGWLDAAVAEYGDRATRLDVPGLLSEVIEARKLVPLIEATQHWLAAGAGDVAGLETVYRAREEAQKPGRALLARSATDRRDHWRPRESGPLTYRWDRVAGFLEQLEGR